MGLLDGLVGSLMGGQQQGGENPLLQMALQMLTNHNNAGGSGGLGGLVSAFQSAGMGDQLKSWIGTGANMPISGEQLTAALGSDKIRDIANQLGMSHGEVSGGLANMLPQFTLAGSVGDDSLLFASLFQSSAGADVASCDMRVTVPFSAMLLPRWACKSAVSCTALVCKTLMNRPAASSFCA